MKKLSQSISKEYRMPRLYLEDLEKIEEAIKESNPKEYKITIGNIEYDNMVEIPQDTGLVHEVKFQAFQPYISLDLRKMGATFYSSEDNLISSGIFSKIDKIMMQNERKLLSFPSSNILVSTLFGVIIGQTAVRALPFEFNATKAIFLLVSILLIVYFVLSFTTVFTSYCVVEFVKKREKKSFFSKYKDQLFLIIFGAIVGSVLTVLLEWFFLK